MTVLSKFFGGLPPSLEAKLTGPAGEFENPPYMDSRVRVAELERSGHSESLFGRLISLGEEKIREESVEVSRALVAIRNTLVPTSASKSGTDPEQPRVVEKPIKLTWYFPGATVAEIPSGPVSAA